MKAISPLIATILLVAIAIAASSIIFIWGKSFIAEQLEKFGEPIETTCQRVKFDAQLSVKEGVYELVISNQGNVKIVEVNIKAKQEGRSIIRAFSPRVVEANPPRSGVGRGETGIVKLHPKSDFDFPKLSPFSIDVTPMLLGKGKSSGKSKLYACQEETKLDLKAPGT